MTKDPAVDGRLGHDVAARGVVPLLRIQPLNLFLVLADDDFCASRDVVWAGYICHAIEHEVISTGAHNVAALHAHVLLGLIARNHRHTDNKDRDAEVCYLHSVIASTLRAKFLKRGELS